MKNIFVVLLSLLLVTPVFAVDFTDTDQLYGWNGSAQFFPTYLEFKTQLQNDLTFSGTVPSGTDNQLLQFNGTTLESVSSLGSIAFNMGGSQSNLLYDTGSNFLLDTDTSVNHVWSASKITSELAFKANLASPTFTGTVSGATGSFTGALTAHVNVITGGTATLTAEQARGSLYITNATSTITLPDAVLGYSVCVVSGQGQTGALTIAIDASDYIVTDGVRGTLGASKASTGAAGDKICLVSDATDWYVTSAVGF